MQPLRVLVTSRTLAHRGGSEMYVRDLALGLHRLGHRIAVYSTELGDLAVELSGAGIEVVDRLDALAESPDLVHGNQPPETLTALLHFPAAPAVWTCHARSGPESAALRFPRLRRAIAVDAATHQRLTDEDVLPSAIVRLPNAVDLDRFRPRAPLPETPRRALVFSNYAREGTGSHLDTVRAACAATGLELDVAGAGAGLPCGVPEALLPGYDLVFAKARCALEAMAVGAAVVLCDATGCGPMVRADAVARLRDDNFGARTLHQALDAGDLEEKIRRYDPADAVAVRDWIRSHCGLDAALVSLVDLYRDVLRDRAVVDPASDMRAAAEYLRIWSPAVRDAAALRHELAEQSRYIGSLLERLPT